jgi:hypothetical protein
LAHRSSINGGEESEKGARAGLVEGKICVAVLVPPEVLYNGGTMNVMHRVQFTSGGRYPVLRAIALIYLFLGGVSIVAGIVSVFWMLIRAPFAPVDRIILAAAALVASVFWCALMLGAAEIIKLFVDLEHNTRMATIYKPATPPAAEMPTVAAHPNRISVLDEETAEAALLRGH